MAGRGCAAYINSCFQKNTYLCKINPDRKRLVGMRLHGGDTRNSGERIAMHSTAAVHVHWFSGFI